MMRLIDADKLHYIKVMILHSTEEDRAKKDVVVFAKEIDKALTVDAVPVARLNDFCKRWTYACAMCTYTGCDKCALRSCIDELKEIIDGGEHNAKAD